MAYSDGEALILTRLQAVANYDSSNTARSNWKLLNRGISETVAIVRPGGFVRRWGTTTNPFTRWRTIVEVWQRYKDDSGTTNSLMARAADILTMFDQYRLLGDTTGKVQDSYIVEGREPREMWARGGNGPAWLMQELILEWTEEVQITFAE